MGLTVPTVLSLVRLIGTPLPIVAAWIGAPSAALAILLILAATDWLDGFLARAWRQQSATGARIDTVADIALGISMVCTATVLFPQFVWQRAAWIGWMAGTYLASAAYSLGKFGRWPSYHTWLAKLGMALVSLAALAILGMNWGVPEWLASWLLVAAALTVSAGNVECLLITCELKQPANNVATIVHAKRLPK